MVEKKTNKNPQKHGDFSKFMQQGKKTEAKQSKKQYKRQIEEEKIKTKKESRAIKNRPIVKEKTGPIRLNRFIANSGLCSRRDADQLIEKGEIWVNNKIVSELGTKVDHSDEVKHKGKVLRPEKMVYLLLNKPKGFITTTDDPYERKTVMSLVEKACPERIIPVGRLDRNTTGLLLFTNDGDLAKKLTHPKYNIKKIYHVVLDKALSKQDITTIAEGIKLDDGLIKVDAIAYAEDGIDKNQIGIELHSGKNRIVRRIFEHLEYKVSRLDRVSFAGLTKKDTPRGKWRFLKEFEISRLKMLG